VAVDPAWLYHLHHVRHLLALRARVSLAVDAKADVIVIRPEIPPAKQNGCTHKEFFYRQ